MNVRWRGKFFDTGSIFIMTLVFVMMFLVIFVGLSGLVGLQFRQSSLQSFDEQAFQVAESGLNYARWRLAHDSGNFSPETQEVGDPSGGTLGSYSIVFEAPQAGSTITLITSTGTTAATPTREVTLKARYGIPSLARYSSITHGDVWYGGQIKGPVHANGGIRMDGTSDSTVTSAKETYVCQSYHGCSNETKPGVWGSGVIQALWSYPAPPVDYNAITLDLLDMKTAAQANGTYYGPSGSFGYNIVFNDNNTYTVYRVTNKTGNIWSWTSETGWEFTSHDVGSQTSLGTNNVPSNGIIYFEDDVWVSGDIRDRVTIASGRFPDSPSTNTDVIINGNITYGGVKDGTRVFGAVAQRHVLIPYSGAPNNLTLDGAYIAQKGRFGRRYYYTGSHILKNTLLRYGMIASNLVPVTAWVNGSGNVTSGYQSGSAEYDPNLLYGPPPYFPTDGQYEFISWEQID